jgi:methylglutaconyl-CoA hydratase
MMLKVETVPVARVTLARPERHNAFNEQVIAGLTDAFTALGRDPAVRAIIVSGEGKSFCAGADLDWMKRAGEWSEAENRADALRMSDMFLAIDTCPKPVIARVHGAVFAGGLGIVACADMVVATADARFSVSEVKLGLIPANISPFLVAKIGASAARRWFLTAELFGAGEAQAMGLVHEVAADLPAADATVDGWVKALAAAAPGAVADAKRLIRDVAGRPITDELRTMTAARIAARRASDEGREGLAAFLEKRPPGWAA